MKLVKLLLIIYPLLCFSMTFEENFALTTNYYVELFAKNNEIKVLFSKNYQDVLKNHLSKKNEILFLFFPQNCGFDLFTKEKKCFEKISEVKRYVESIGFKVSNFQVISELANFKDLSEMNAFYLKYFDQTVDLVLLEKKFLNHTQDYFFLIKFCLLRLTIS